MHKRRLGWFKVAMAAGLLLAVMLLVGTTANYLYVAYHLVPRHIEGEATRLLTLLKERAQRGVVLGSEQWRAMLDEIRREHSGQIDVDSAARLRRLHHTSDVPTWSFSNWRAA